MSKKTASMLLGLAALVLVVGCTLQYRSQQQSRKCEKQLFAMDTIMSFTAYGQNGEKAVDSAMQEIQRLDALLSIGSPASEVSQINAAGGGTVSADVAELLHAATGIYETTGGLFDFTIYPLMELWGFPSENYHVPSQEELSKLLPLVNASKVRLEDGQVTLAENQRMDFGGIAKGYAAARVIHIFREHGVTSGMVSLGGNVQVLGSKPDGTPWRIGIQDPSDSRGAYLAVLPVEDRAVVTSGGYERYFEEGGQTYIHILDPRTGCPADSDLLSATVVSEDGTLADGLSTSLFIMGLEGAISYWRSNGGTFDMVLISKDRNVYVTEGISDTFQTEENVVTLPLAEAGR